MSFPPLARLAEHLRKNELIRRVIKNSAYLFSSTGISAGLSMLQGILAARLLGVYAFGLLGAVISFTTVINILASFRMNELVIKYVGQFTEQGDTQRAAAVFKAASLVEIVTSFFAYGLLWLLAPLGAVYIIKDPAATTWIQVYGLILIANLMAESATGFLGLFDRFGRIAAINIAQSFVTLALIAGIFVVYQVFDRPGSALYAVLLAYMVGKILSAVGLTLTVLLDAGWRWGSGWWRVSLGLLRDQRRELLHFGLSTNLSASINLINKNAEILWVTFFRSPLEAGYYKLALALVNLVQMPVAPLPQATYPELTREVSRKNWINVRYILRQGTLMAGGYTLVAVLGLAIFGLPLIRWIYGVEFLPAFPALMILIPGYLVANMFYWNRSLLLSLGLPDYPTKVNFVAALAKIILAFLLVPTFGYLGSAALLSGYYLFSVSLNVRKSAQVLKQRQEAAAETVQVL
jgi:O-antigen/teichoic acid export membrane protein